VIIGIGCDIIEIDRIRKAIKNQAFVERLFTPFEIEKSLRFQDLAPYFAGRFAAKEALSKALGTGIGSKLSWHSMEIVNDDQGKPLVIWSKEITNRYGIAETHLSISHSKSTAIAYAIVEQ
jgi:holo-[acyl-carrier protein] synthase